ncbi:MAG TPA: hypothetical protein VN881_00535 [Candidatus Acidoferrales bacterium]|nr:hypothetical protein [Candidatus Acidoferrales bacterium]
MKAESIDYRAVLADLKERRVNMDIAIAALEVLCGEPTVVIGATKESHSTEIQADTFVGLNIAEAASKYLRMMGRGAKSTEQVAESLVRGGLAVTQASVSSILRKNNRTGEGDVIKVGRGLWGLQEWYPGRPRRSRQGNEEEK